MKKTNKIKGMCLCTIMTMITLIGCGAGGAEVDENGELSIEGTWTANKVMTYDDEELSFKEYGEKIGVPLEIQSYKFAENGEVTMIQEDIEQDMTYTVDGTTVHIEDGPMLIYDEDIKALVWLGGFEDGDILFEN